MDRRRNGPGAFLVSLGTVVLLAGLMVFLAMPAAEKMDRKEADQRSQPLGNDRQKGVVRTAFVASGTGAALIAVGLVLLARRRH